MNRANSSAIKVVYFQRRPSPGKFSLEGYFKQVRGQLASKIEAVEWTLPFFSRGLFRRLLNLLSVLGNQGDVNHITGDVHYVALFMNRNRTLLTIPDCEILTRLTGWKRRIVKLFWYTLPARNVAAITVISEATKKQLLEEISFCADDIHVIPVSVSDKFQPSPKVFNEQTPCILQIGTKVNKNIVRLAMALKGLKCRVEIVGKIREEQAQALQENEIHYDNYLDLTEDEIVDRYRSADVVSFVSTYEGFGMPIIEAQSVERVCVTANCSSMPEVAGAGACRVDPFDVISIRQGFVKVMSDPKYRDSLIAHGRENKLRFAPQQIAEQYLGLYQHLAAFKGENDKA